MVRQCSVRYFIETQKLETELSVFEARSVANLGARCRWSPCVVCSMAVAVQWDKTKVCAELFVSSSSPWTISTVYLRLLTGSFCSRNTSLYFYPIFALFPQNVSNYYKLTRSFIESTNFVFFWRVILSFWLKLLSRGGPMWAREHCRISPPYFLTKCCKMRLIQGSFVLRCLLFPGSV